MFSLLSVAATLGFFHSKKPLIKSKNLILHIMMQYCVCGFLKYLVLVILFLVLHHYVAK